MPGAASGPVSGQPYTGPGGIALRVNGAPQGSPRSNLNLVSSPGLSWVVTDDPGNNRVNAEAQFRGEVLLGEVTGQLAIPGTILATPVSSLTVQQVKITRVVVVCEAISGAGTQPQFEAGTDAQGNPPNGDVAAAQPLAFTAVGQEQELTLLNPRAMVTQTPPLDVLRIRQTVAATGYTTYQVGFKVFGAVVTP